MKTKLHTALLYPLILIFSSILKGKKTDYKNFFIDDKKEFKKSEILEVFSKENQFYENIQLFFDKNSPLYDTTFVTFELDITKAPEKKKYFAFDFSRVVNIYYTLSMLSARVPNENINVDFVFKKQKLTDEQINHLLRYSLFTFASKRVDKLCFDKKLLQDDKSVLAYETMIAYINNATILNFTNAKNLYVLTCKKGKDTFDIIWSAKEDIELTDFNKVYDKYGNLLKKDIKISNSPIYAFHK
jgi:hypothetical protein